MVPNFRMEIEVNTVQTYDHSQQVSEAIEDAHIMLDQTRLLYGDAGDMEEYKLNRLWARMEVGK